MKLPDIRPKIRRGQLWKKKDTGLVVEVTGKDNKKRWSYRKLKGGPTHSVAEKDMYLFWEKI